jgi:hypothetical protein
MSRLQVHAPRMSKKALLLVALAVVACKSDPAGPPKPATASLTDLTTSLDAVRAEFNAHETEPRFVTLLSAT